MANPIKGEVELNAGDKVYTLCLSVNAMVELEAIANAGPFEIQAWFNDPASLRLGNLRAMMWAALRQHHPEVDLLTAGDVVQAIGLGRAVEVLGTALQAAFPQGGDENPRKAPPVGTGRRSSSTSSR